MVSSLPSLILFGGQVACASYIVKLYLSMNTIYDTTKSLSSRTCNIHVCNASIDSSQISIKYPTSGVQKHDLEGAAH